MQVSRNFWSLVIAAIIFSSPSLNACTDFKLEAHDGTILITRSMEFAQDLKSNLRSSPRGRIFSSTLLNNKPSLSWASHYGYLYVDGFGLDASFDGINETGLSFEYLYLPGETQYQTISEGNEKLAIPYIHFGDWILSNFKTIEEIKSALNQVVVVSVNVPELGNAVLPAHASIYDASGKGIVIEFYNDKINIYDNIGIMTNSPKYDWHVNNLRNYLNLSAFNPQTISKDGMNFIATGQGSGAVGLPGDASPPSRFIKIAFMLKNVFKAQNSNELINLAQHIINNVDIPAGYVRSINEGKIATDFTQWVVFKDLSHKIFYYRTYGDLALRSIMMKDVDFSEHAKRLKMPLVSTSNAIDMSKNFLNSQ
ncbi:MAG: linear amide C-N hydrolase [Tatlockia sp.]|nr:linear amide C-N hydrolase [Tatlockia sp.]